ncbi:hypothetical protein IP91_01819 [Pseudoduganella lurida]|uniref:Phytase-like domain-containing protein n=1 Tax=Pseudoduganella lurida TaxID=1036180 RepID=A0A562RH62_9BURK|nr:esterase-like activity of phytase family protein [Pseudoduganella lurida]TWI67700.1 hypothetical protein IP91_01819 [Pseudoduganella lurida]
MHRFTNLAVSLGLACLLAACATVSDTPERIGSLRFIGEQRIPLKTAFEGTTFGGISGIDYDARRGDWVLVSDDRSALAPARVYRARLRFDAASFQSVTLTGMTLLRQADGSTYPDEKAQATRGGVVPDFESLRVDPRDGSLWYSSEGDRRLGLDPFVRHAGADGTLRGELPLPAMFRVSPDAERGTRNNLAFEGLSFAPDGASLWVAMEAPLYQDGPVPSLQQGALSRITQYARDGKVLGQYAYPVEPIAAAPGAGKYADNGISEMLAVGPATLLVLERAGVQGEDGRYRNFIRLYEAAMGGADDIRAVPSLADRPPVPVTKRLVLDFASLGLPVLDNVEAFGFGPRLPNGHRTLVFASDDNFNANQVTQLLLFEVLQ